MIDRSRAPPIAARATVAKSPSANRTASNSLSVNACWLFFSLSLEHLVFIGLGGRGLFLARTPVNRKVRLDLPRFDLVTSAKPAYRRQTSMRSRVHRGSAFMRFIGICILALTCFAFAAKAAPAQPISARNVSVPIPAGGDGTSVAPILSADGRFVVFSSAARNLL